MNNNPRLTYLPSYSNAKYQSNYVNIDSAHRTIETQYQYDKIIKLSSDPLSMHNDEDNYLMVSIPNHNYRVGDKISINGVSGKSYKMRTYTDGEPVFQFIENSDYLKIFYDDNSECFSQINKNKKNGGLCDIINEMVTNNNYDLYVTINGFIGDSPNSPYIGNIPIYALNCRHKIYFTLNGTKIDNRFFYIKLPDFYVNTTKKNLGSYNITIKLEYVCGIPLDIICSNHVINKTAKDWIAIKLDVEYYDSNNKFGGNDIHIKKIKNIIYGYKTPSEYTIFLDRSYSNVVGIAMVSSEFINTAINIRRGINDMFCWNNLEDGEKMYSVIIKPGNYSPNVLENMLSKLIMETKRELSLNYLQNNFIDININLSNNTTCFCSYKIAVLVCPIVSVRNLNNKNGDIIIYFKHPYHNVKIGEIIEISGAISHDGIPDSLINGKHKINTVETHDTYGILISALNLQEKISTGGGNRVQIKIPNMFRIRNDHKNSICNNLGFSNCGNKYAITNYNSIITNYDDYSNVECINTPKAINLCSENYILMHCNPFEELACINSTNNNNIHSFAKILITGNYGEKMLNSFVHTPYMFPAVIPKLFKLDFKFTFSDGKIYDFMGIDHSFTLDIICVDDKPIDTNISCNLGKVL